MTCKMLSSSCLTAIAFACAAAPAMAADKPEPLTAWEDSRTVNDSDMVTTGVARGRDRLDSATSTSSIREGEINKIAPRSMAELFRNIPGIRVEASGGENFNNYTVRGLPLVGGGAKYIQIQEDGLPVMEFGDFQAITPDLLTRIDLNLGQVESIRGGSSSTFASNAPGGVINLISKTGEVEGGSVMATVGLDYETYRTDFDYGGRLSDTWRFHIGGFYRSGEGGRATGRNSYDGGQVKLNLTKQFDGGFIRFYGKYLDDRSPSYRYSPILISGTNASPVFKDLPGYSASGDSVMSPYINTIIGLNPNGNLERETQGNRIRSAAAGLEAQFEISDFNITERFRFTKTSGTANSQFPVFAGPTAVATAAFGIPGASLTYATGPRSGQAVTAPYLAVVAAVRNRLNDVGSYTNDLRISRVWKVGDGNLTTTAGLYKARQSLDVYLFGDTQIQDIVGDGGSSLVNATIGGVPVTTAGNLLFSLPGNSGSQNNLDVDYDIVAPYGSFNYHEGAIAVGGSLRYDFGKVNGTIANSVGTADLRSFDVNGDGVISPAERSVAFIPSTRVYPVNYDYGYLSYSVGVNFRVSEPFAIFARYSRGARAGADKLLFTPAISTTDGSLVSKPAGHDPVRQAEVGLKFRRDGLSVNITGFYATVDETNSQINQDAAGNSRLQSVSRSYKAYGAEFEASLRRGPFSLTAGATLAKAEITAAETPAIVGNTPRHQPTLLFQVTPQYDVDRFTIGANIVGTTSSYAQDVNQLRLPGYTTVGAFLQYRPVDRVELSLNASNLFDTRAITETLGASVPATGVGLAQTLYGRTVSTSARFFF